MARRWRRDGARGRGYFQASLQPQEKGCDVALWVCFYLYTCVLMSCLLHYWETAEFPFEVLPKLAALFIAGGTIKGYGCPGLSITGIAIANAEIARVDSFHCRHGNAYLFNKVENVTVGEIEARMMMTGMHTVVDIFCVTCGSIVGWKYEFAFEMTQKYKEGKFILERF